MTGADVIAMPGIGRVILAFLIVAGLAVAIAVALRRTLPKFGAALSSSSRVRVVDRARLGTGLQVHVLEVDDAKVLLAESRAGLALIVLGKHTEQGP